MVSLAVTGLVQTPDLVQVQLLTHLIVCLQISTKKDQHSRLGEDNLDDTLEYDFSGPALRRERLGSQKPLMGDSNPAESEDVRQTGDRN